VPPAYITCAEFDPNSDEALVYAQGLLQADVPVATGSNLTDAHLNGGG